jgi:hypothetical protein
MEVVGTFGGAEGIEDVADGVPEQVDASGCGASEQGLQPPIRSGWIVPRWCQRCISLTTKLVLTSNLAAAARRDAPSLGDALRTLCGHRCGVGGAK